MDVHIKIIQPKPRMAAAEVASARSRLITSSVSVVRSGYVLSRFVPVAKKFLVNAEMPCLNRNLE
jgi:hypothetical protein